MIKQAHFFLLLAIVILGFSCTPTKQMVYFNDLEKVKQATLMSSPQDNAEHKIENNEMLSIRITSPTTEKSAYEMLNVTNDTKAGYLVDNGGNIEIPLLGALKAAGLTKSQLKEAILKQISDRRILIDPIVDIRFLNYEITVLGEVAKPNVITVPNDKISLLKALSLSGDITAFGKRENVMIIRENEGKKVVTRVNLNSSTFLQSPYYYLQPNDVVYVETTSNRSASVDKTRLILPAVMSAISVLVLAIDRLPDKAIQKINMQQRGNKTAPKEDGQVGQMLAGYISYWPLFLICLALALGGAYFYIRYSVPKYEASAKILLKDEKKGETDSKTLEQLDAISTKKIIDNEIEVLQSQQLLDSVAVKLGLYAPIIQEGQFRIVSGYHTFPLRIKVKHPEKITGWNRGMPLSYNKKKKAAVIDNKITCPVGEWVDTKYGELMFEENADYWGTKEDKPFFFDLVKVQSMGNALGGSLKVEASGKNSSVVNLKYTDEVPLRAERILNELIHFYNQSAIIEKNNLVRSTVASIDARLAVLKKDIDSTQKKVKNFKASNRAVDLGSQAGQSLNIIASSDIKAAEADMQLKSLNDLKRVVTTNDKIGILPSAMGINDQTLTQQMTALQNAQIELERMKKTVGEGNPIIVELKERITQMKPGIVSSIQTQIQNVELSRGTYVATSGRFNSTLGAIPEKERELFDISRDLNTQNGIYAFLLQKKEESELSYTNTNTDSKVVNYAEAGGTPVSPKTSMIYFAAVLLGLILPIAIVNGREMLNNKILYRKEIEALTTIPVIGEIVHNKAKTSLVLEPGKRSFIAEEFRKVRVSLLFLGIDSYHKKILVTSSLPGEGKSFVAANLAVSLAMTGKKVVLVDADLHNPSLGKVFGVTTEEIGVSNFLLGEQKVDEIIRKVPNHENLSFISSGGLHPTPSELLENGEIQKLVSALEDRFDLVVIDTAPVVMVTDAYHLSSLADATLYVIRHKYTPKMVVKRIDENNKINSLKNPAIVFNGVKTRGFMKNNYGYGYDYVYGKNAKKNKGYKLKA